MHKDEKTKRIATVTNVYILPLRFIIKRRGYHETKRGGRDISSKEGLPLALCRLMNQLL